MSLFETFIWENISIRKAIEQDISFICDAENIPENASFIAQWTPEQHHNLLLKSSALYLIAQTHEGKKLGFIILDNLDSIHKNIEFKRIVITEKGKGYGRLFLQAAMHLVFNVFKSHRLWLDVVDFNLRAKHLYESEGFKTEGVWRECWLVNDKYHSLIFLSILEHEYNAMHDFSLNNTCPSPCPVF